MFLDRLIARSEGRLPVPRNSPSLAQEMDHPAYGQPAKDDAEDDDLTTVPAAPILRNARSPTVPAEIAADGALVRDQTAAPTAAARRRTESVAPLPPEPAGAAPTVSQSQVPMATPMAAEALPRPDARPSFSDPLPAMAPPQPEPIANAAPARSAPTRLESNTVSPQHEQVGSSAPAPILPQPLPVPSAPSTALQEPALSAMPDPIEIHLEIGRIDLVSTQTKRPRPNGMGAHVRPGPLLTLTDYLDLRRGSR